MHSTQCHDCAWYIGDGQCVAFYGKSRIPEGIVTGQIDHIQPYPGDHGTQWRSRNGLTGTEIVKLQLARLEKLEKR